MNNVYNWFNDSFFTEPLSPACKMCAQGSKMVVLLTGLCPESCFYCPLSQQKIRKDRIFANEWELDNEEDTSKLIQEAKYIDATGAGFTGGDPLVVWKRANEYIKLLKEEFGNSFHIHLYTSGKKNSDKINDLVSSGLDEIRFHPMLNYWDKMNISRIKNEILSSLKTNIDVAIEIPVIPDKKQDILSLIKWADELKIKWINLNELEFSETNADALNSLGFTVKDDISAAVKGSEELAKKIINESKNLDLDIGIHYCSSSFKDGIQLRNRILRRAKNVSKDHEIITEDGTLIKGIITSKKIPVNTIKEFLIKKYKIQENKIFINKEKKQVELDVITLEKISKELMKYNLSCFMVEVYPTADALEVEKIPLPFN